MVGALMKLVPPQDWELGLYLLYATGLSCPPRNTVKGHPAAGPSQGLREAGPRGPEPGGAAGRLLCPPGQGTCSTHVALQTPRDLREMPHGFLWRLPLENSTQAHL